MKSISPFIVCMLVLLNLANAQPSSVISSNSRNYAFTYSVTNLQGSPQITRSIIDALAQSSGKNPINVNYQVSFDQKLELLAVGNYLQINVQNNFLQATGDVYYRNFYVGDLLTPNSINLLVNLLDERGGMLRSFQISNLNAGNGYSTSLNTNMMPTGSYKMSLQVVNMMVYYTNQTMSNFSYRTNLINDYYNSNMLLDNAQNQLASIVYVSPDNVEATTSILQQVENDISVIESHNYNSSLQLNSQDPINLKSRIASLRNVLAQKRLSVNMAYASLDSYYYTKGLEAVANKSTAMATTFFTKSLAINPIFAPSAYQLARLQFEDGNLLNADVKLREVWYTMNPDPNTYQNALTLFKNIYNEYIESADQLANSGKYKDALKDYDRAEKLCREINGVQCNNSAKASIKNCRQAIYNGLLSEAKTLANNNNNNEAYAKFNEAKNYAKDNNSDVQDRSAEQDVERSLKFNDYTFAVNDAKQAFVGNDFSTALASFETAHDLESKYVFSPSIIPLDMEQKSAKGVILKKLDALNEMMSKNDWEAMKAPMAKVNEMQAFYKLENDKDINSTATIIREKVKQNTCEMAVKQFDEFVQKAKAAAAGNNYIVASDFYEKAIKHAEENRDCSINSSAASDEKIAIIAPSTYQKFINKILVAQTNGKYAEAVTQYNEAMVYYSQYDLSKFNIAKKSLLNFSIDNFKNSAIDYVAIEFRKKGQLDDAYTLYETLIQRRYPLRNINASLYDLGVAMGNRDKAAGEINPKVKVKSYSKNASQWKHLKNGYLSAFKK